MILIVDDDEASLSIVRHVLTKDGHRVLAFQDATLALAELEGSEPELIISDMVMPAMTGAEFRTAYSERFPSRRTPFMFLSSLSDPNDIVAGLDLGADDYLIKPIAAQVLLAKVRAHLRRARASGVAAFRGDLAKFPFANLMQYCELKKLTGEVEVRADEKSFTVHFETGELRDPAGADVVEQLLSLGAGVFTIRVAPLDFSELQPAAAGEPPVPAPRPSLGPRDQPAGRLSGVQLGTRLFQIQTEFSTTPSEQVVTVVMLNGRSVLKRVRPPLESGREALERQIAEQHASVEDEVRQKLRAHVEKTTTETSKTRFDRLLDEGLSKFLARDYAAALVAWEEAHTLEPDNKALQVNLQVARKKTQG